MNPLLSLPFFAVRPPLRARAEGSNDDGNRPSDKQSVCLQGQFLGDIGRTVLAVETS
jgi:hypothetical protein